MPDKFTKFVLKLAEDPKTLERLSANPESVMAEHELTSAEQSVLLAGDSIRIRDTIAAELGVSGPNAAAEWVIVLVNFQTTVKSIEAKASVPRFADVVKRFR